MSHANRQPIRYYLTLWLKGFCMGAADVVPGVSGGTMAFILGIYEELIRGIRSFDWRVLKLVGTGRIGQALDAVPWRFLLALGLGILTAIFSLAKGITWLLVNQPVLIWSFFFGLVLASIVTVTKHFQEWRPSNLFWMAVGTVLAYWVVGLLPMATPDAAWFLFLSGSIAICAMILPGISGSFVLVLLGKYQYVLEAVNNRDFLTLAVVAAGAAMGLILFSRILNWLFTKRHDLTIALLGGLMLGSLRKVWPWKALHTAPETGLQILANVLPGSWSSEVTWAIALAVVGAAAVVILEWAAGRRQ